MSKNHYFWSKTCPVVAETFQKTRKLLETFQETAGNVPGNVWKRFRKRLETFQETAGNVLRNDWKRPINVSDFWIRLGNVSVPFPKRIPSVSIFEKGTNVGNTTI